MLDTRRASPLLRWGVSLAVLGTLGWWLDPVAIVAEITRFSPAWLLVALALTVIQTVLSAWRWRFTTRRLRLDLSWPRAVGDYYLAAFVNQVMPGGVLGDALRAHRHASDSGSTGPAWRAVIIERASGQAVVLVATIGVLVTVPAGQHVRATVWPGGAEWILPLLGAGLLAALGFLLAWRWPVQWRALCEDLHAALLARHAWAVQMGASLAIVSSYALVFAFAGYGIGASAGFDVLLAVAMPILLAMLIPLSVAGWGFREAAAAAVWLALGLPAEQGVAVALAYGLIALLGSLPGALVLACRPAN